MMARAKKTETKGATNTVAITPIGANEPNSDMEMGIPKTWAPVDAESDEESFGGNKTDIKRMINFENKRIPASAP